MSSENESSRIDGRKEPGNQKAILLTIVAVVALLSFSCCCLPVGAFAVWQRFGHPVRVRAPAGSHGSEPSTPPPPVGAPGSE